MRSEKEISGRKSTLSSIDDSDRWHGAEQYVCMGG